MECTVKWMGPESGMSLIAETGSGHMVAMDGAPEGGGNNLAPRPMEMMLAGAGGCAAYDVVLILKRGRHEITGCQVELDAERAETDPKVFDALLAFAADIGMVPIALHKEKAGYVLNSLLVPLLNAAAELAAGGYADPHDVDKVWRIATGAPLGPFQIYDIIGLTTPYNILSHGNTHTQQLAAWLKEHYIDHGKLGVASGEGFYRYDKTPN